MAFSLPRRTFLRGIAAGSAVAVGLPPLEAMFNANGNALAQGQPLPKRFGVWFWGNGVRRAHWTPDGTGTGWTPRAELEPFTLRPGLRDYVSPVTGLEIKSATHAHHSGMAGIMTGARYHLVGPTRDTIVSSFAYPSIDQVVAERLYNDPTTRTPFRSLEVGVCTFRGTDEGTTFQHLSHNGPNNVNASEYNPMTLFNRLFGAPLDAQKTAARRTVLDAVKRDVDRLKPRLSSADVIRIDQHLSSIRSIEERLATSAAVCATPRTPNADYPEIGGQEPIQEKNEIMSDILAMALACDLTRSFSVLFSTAGAGTVFWMSGAQNGLHQIAHDERAPGAEPQPTLHSATVFTMQQCAYFLDRLRSIQEGATNLLENSAILCTTELSEGNVHSNDEFPILVAGRAGGALRGGVHYRSGSRENTTKVLLTLLRAMGDTRASYGVAEGESSEVIPDLLT
jgi:hypothetical protein